MSKITTIQVKGKDYEIETSDVKANPVLSGDEADLTGLEVDGTKYKVEQQASSKAYLHFMRITSSYYIKFTCSQSTPFTVETFAQYLYAKGITVGENTSPINAEQYVYSRGTTMYYMGVYSEDGVTAYFKRYEGTAMRIINLIDSVYEL